MLGRGVTPVNSTALPARAQQCTLSRATLVAAVGRAPTPPPIPPSCSDCATKTQPAGGAPPSQSASRLWRSSDGKFRLDTPTSSVITDPSSQKAILLDHIKKEATILPMPPAAAGSVPGMPGMGPAAAGPVPAMHVEDLGRSMIEGHEVEGKRFTLPPPTPPTMPQMKAPGAPQAPSKPGVPAAPGVPKPPQMPTLPKVPSVTEVWTSVKLKTPVLTKLTTGAGEQTTYCKPTSMQEPHPSVFQIPPDYKIKPPTPPAAPRMPAAPKPPKL